VKAARTVRRRPRISEKEFQAQVLDFARLSGWLCYHTHDSRRSAPGFPDLVLVRPPVVVFAELKAEAGRVRVEQEVWLKALASSESVEAVLWRPRDWPEIEQTLQRSSARRGRVRR
jgi:hypothetical protein